MILRRVHPTPGGTIDLEAADAREQLLDWYRPPSADWLRLNLVSTVNGSAAGSDGTSDTITSETDRRILGAIRDHSDVVLVGAASVRAEGYRVPKNSRLAVLTSRGELEGHRVAADALDRLIVICPPAVSAGIREVFPGATVLNAALVDPERSDSALSVASSIAALRDRGFASIVCEGGPNLAGQLLNERLVDELCLTVSPLLTTTALPLPTTEARLTLSQLLIDESSSMYSRWTVNPSVRAATSATI
jgi:riboflavin biosynthesis pyrimidine reductase